MKTCPRVLSLRHWAVKLMATQGRFEWPSVEHGIWLMLLNMLQTMSCPLTLCNGWLVVAIFYDFIQHCSAPRMLNERGMPFFGVYSFVVWIYWKTLEYPFLHRCESLRARYLRACCPKCRSRISWQVESETFWTPLLGKLHLWENGSLKTASPWKSVQWLFVSEDSFQIPFGASQRPLTIRHVSGRQVGHQPEFCPLSHIVAHFGRYCMLATFDLYFTPWRSLSPLFKSSEAPPWRVW